jgi:hypothetical protein
MRWTNFKEDQNSLDFNTFVLTKRMLSCLHHDLVWRCIEMLPTSHKFPITWGFFPTWRKCWGFLHIIHVSNMCSMSIGTCEWDIKCGSAWMGTWFKCMFQKLKLLTFPSWCNIIVFKQHSMCPWLALSLKIPSIGSKIMF